MAEWVCRGRRQHAYSAHFEALVAAPLTVWAIIEVKGSRTSDTT